MIRVVDLPKVRKKFLSILHLSTHGKLAEQIATLDNSDEFFTFSKHFAHEVEKCDLWWASDDMTKLALGARDNLPDWTPTFAMPASSGLLHWASNAITCDGTPVDTAIWIKQGSQLHISLYKSLPSGDLEPAQVSMVESDEPFSQSSFAIKQDRATAPIVQLIGATWLLMQQPTISEIKRTNRGKGHRGKQPVEINDVQIINLRTLARDDTEPRKQEGTREYHHRWVVGGHWRQQACGPGRKQRKPVFILPYVKGPEDAPLKTERVNVWRR